MPPLRDRCEDILPLARHFLRHQAELYGEPEKCLSDEVAAALVAYAWPGNVRELANTMEHAHVIASSGEVRLDELPPRLRAIVHPRRTTQRLTDRPDLCLRTLEAEAIREALSRTRNNKAAAARLLGINIQRLSRRIADLGISAS